MDYEQCKVTDFSKLDIRDGVIHYRLYQQDGTLQPMTIADTYSNRLLVSWMQIHDRYVFGEEVAAPRPLPADLIAWTRMSIADLERSESRKIADAK